MAAPCLGRFWQKCQYFSQISLNCGRNQISRHYSSNAEKVKKRDVEQLFIDDKVQQLLRRVTGFDIDKIFHTRKTLDPEPPQYKLLTDTQLEQEVTDAVEQGRRYLQMPPYLEPWNTEYEVISNDPEIAGFETQNVNYVFTDITYGLPNHKRTVVIREPGGLLRTANAPERDRILHTYYPQEGRHYKTPSLFQEEGLERLLGQHKYEYVLDAACVQFEPSNPEYIRVVHRTYEHVNSSEQFSLLRSTRHFGGMTFYLTLHKKIDLILLDMLTRNLISDAGDLIRLYHLVHPDSQSATDAKQNNINKDRDLVQLYASTDSKQAGRIELALQSLDNNV